MTQGHRFQPDPRFFRTAPPLTLADAVQLAGAEIVEVGAEGRPREVTHVAPATAAGEGAVSFIESKKALAAATVEPALVLVPPAALNEAKAHYLETAIGVTDTPKAGFAAIARALHTSKYLDGPSDGSPAEVHGSAVVHPTAVVMADAEVAEGVRIGPYAVIGPGVTVGEQTIIGAHCVVTHAHLGRGCVISAGVTIGEAGFGYVPDGGRAAPVPQLGRVLISDGVDLGANTTVDRGALGDTVIGEGTKIDNQVQVAHNCVIGRHVLVASQTGISGSCQIGDGVMIGGQAGMADHLVIGDGAVVTAKAGLMRDIPPGEKWGGIPAKPAREWMKDVAAISKLSKKGK